MTLAAGSRLGPYEILAPLGAGGMGEVYRAQDTRLERTVAVKVLPPHLSSSLESRQRFEREAKTISQLSHPHICALYDVGSEGETEYLVMEYLEGESLSDRLGKGALPLEQTLRYGVEMADALDKAHRQGIVHRDLKPGNVMITKSGVKLLDFGLAKAMAPVTQQSGLTSLPTMPGAANLTQAGTILGTFQYMAPEQLEGKEADARTDIFALGAVLYEMVTGRKAFSGSSQASLISAIMKEEPAPISGIQPMSPPALDRVVKTCLAKDPEDRWQSAHDVGNELKWIAEGSQAGVPAIVAGRRKSRERLAWTLVGLATALAAVFAAGYFRRTPRRAPLIRASLVLPEKMFLGDVAVSPDGKRVAFTMSKAGAKPSLWIRDLDAETAQPIPAADEASFPFWSPDSRFIGFFSEGKLKKVDLAGGTILTVCDAEVGLGGTWSRDGTILFAPSATSPLFRIPVSGGKPVQVTKLEASRHETAHRYPYFLPDGRHFLYMATGLGGSSDEAANAIRVASLDGKMDRALIRVASNAQYIAGHVLYGRDGALLSQRLDPSRLEVEGDPFVVAPRVDRPSDWSGFFAFSVSEGALVLESPSFPPSRLLWFERSGKAAGSIGEPAMFGGFPPRLSPDGRRVAATIFNPAKNTSGLWIYETASGTETKFIFAPSFNAFGVWSPDGGRLLFASDRETHGTKSDLWIKAIDGSGEEPYFESPDAFIPWDWSRDGRFVVVQKIPLKGKRNKELWVLDAADRTHQIPFASHAYDQGEARFSPDGEWIAYRSDESGTAEIYVRPFPGPGGTWKVSTAGGENPCWRADGKELFYASLDNQIMVASVSLEPTFHAGTPTALFSVHAGSSFDASADGQKFLVNMAPESLGSPPLSLLINWTALLKKNESAR